jgi:hypothetical protein
MQGGMEQPWLPEQQWFSLPGERPGSTYRLLLCWSVGEHLALLPSHSQ